MISNMVKYTTYIILIYKIMGNNHNESKINTLSIKFIHVIS